MKIIKTTLMCWQSHNHVISDDSVTVDIINYHLYKNSS